MNFYDFGSTPEEKEKDRLEKSDPSYEYNINGNEVRKRKKGKALAFYHEFVKKGYLLSIEDKYSTKGRYYYFFKIRDSVIKKYKNHLKWHPKTEQDRFIKNCFWYESRIMLTACCDEEYAIKIVMASPMLQSDLRHSYIGKRRGCEWALDDLINNYDEYLNGKSHLNNPAHNLAINYYEGMEYIYSVPPGNDNELPLLKPIIADRIIKEKTEFNEFVIPDLSTVIDNLNTSLKAKRKTRTIRKKD